MEYCDYNKLLNYLRMSLLFRDRSNKFISYVRHLSRVILRLRAS